MWFRKLDYPKGQPFAIPYFTEFFYAGSVILIVILVITNIVLAGNDVVTVLKKDPNNTDSKCTRHPFGQTQPYLYFLIQF
ncbi:hypothetical protein OPQ81_003595 [Rhizoctonia solani]|nr:hypothetical protein OPQ81_003595 [Rhizoctonia solani]